MRGADALCQAVAVEVLEEILTAPPLLRSGGRDLRSVLDEVERHRLVRVRVRVSLRVRVRVGVRVRVTVRIRVRVRVAAGVGGRVLCRSRPVVDGSHSRNLDRRACAQLRRAHPSSASTAASRVRMRVRMGLRYYHSTC